MNRSNVGNVATNGMQILSVAATTASRMLGKADSALNAATDNLKNAEAGYMDAQTKQLGGSPPEMGDRADINNANSRAALYNAKASKIGSESDVDTLMANSPQVPAINQKMSNDKKFLQDWISSYGDDMSLNDIISDMTKGGK